MAKSVQAFLVLFRLNLSKFKMLSEQNQHIAKLKQLRSFSGSPGEFWPLYLENITHLVGAEYGLLQVQSPAANLDKNSEQIWKTMSVWPAIASVENAATMFSRAGHVAEHAAVSLIHRETTREDGFIVAGARLDLPEDQPVSVIAFTFDQDEVLPEALLKIQLLADIPAGYQENRSKRFIDKDVPQFAEALDIMVLLNGDIKYLKAVMTFCNEIAMRYGCSRVSLGWLRGNYVRVQSISHMEKFEKKMAVVQALEAVMEEALDQDEEILYPRPQGNTSVVHDHEKFARLEGIEHIVSLPVRIDDRAVAVLSCERNGKHFDEVEIRGLRLLCDQAARRLSDLHDQDRWFGARLAKSVKQGVANFFSVENTFSKLIGLTIFLCLCFMIFWKVPYRIEAPFILKTDDLLYIPSPYDGYIHEVFVQVGDTVAKGDPMLKLDDRELLLEESSAIADMSRYTREAEKARAVNGLADMRVALAMREQAHAQLKIVRYYLANASINAPFTGIVVEGDLTEMLGAPIRKGDILFKLALLEKLYVEVDIDERDIHELSGDETGEIAFVSQPQLKFPISVENIDPIAVTKESGNVFTLRSSLTEGAKSWWRPGMSGIAKVDAGKRSLLWIFTHRTVEFFRMLLWW